MKKTPQLSEMLAANVINKLPKGYSLFTGDDSFHEGDLIAYKLDDTGSPISWLELGGGNTLIKKHIKLIKEVPVWRKT
jgi:hypothetical protein